jgi:uncharacterized small protein (DUF1192 family)
MNELEKLERASYYLLRGMKVATLQVELERFSKKREELDVCCTALRNEISRQRAERRWEEHE